MVLFSRRNIIKTGTSAGDLAVGETITLQVGGSPYEFIVVNQGIPAGSSIYDSSCNGTWLLMKNLYESRRWHSSNVNDYANSTIHSHLNGTFLGMLDANTQAAIKQVKIPYRAGSGKGKTVTSGSNGLSAKIFLLSSTEVNLVHGYEPTNEGACLSYFSGTAQNAADSKRVANLNGSATTWWLRSPYCNSNISTTTVLYVTLKGTWYNYGGSDSRGIRPAMILDPNTKI